MNAAHCPSCALAAKPQAWDDVSAFKCEGCHGHFVPGPTLEDFLATHGDIRAHRRLLEKAHAAALTSRPLTCPHCRTRTYHAVQLGVVEIDVCGTCGGVFLDQNEAVLYFRQVRDRFTANKAADKTADTIDDAVGNTATAVDAADVVLSIGNFISKLIH